MSAASVRSRRETGVPCRRGLLRVDRCLWARLLGVLGSAALLGTTRSLALGWEAPSWGADAVKHWVDLPGVLGGGEGGH
jgi:hypothetical protein